MQTVLYKFIFGGLFIFVAWKGIDGILINIYHGELTRYDIGEFEEVEIHSERNLEISNGIPLKGNSIFYQPDRGGDIDVIYPIISSAQYDKLVQKKPINIKVFVRLDKQSPYCAEDGGCIPDAGEPIRGLVKSGFENLDFEDFKMIESELINIDKNCILIKLNEKPLIWYWNFLMLLVGMIFSITILKSFFKKASNLKEYWEKITEKDLVNK
ncbi:hypothetical protein [Echinicola sp. 20G]|uniref:hypothetical protein n=1 Tax=Echinicola sp. 20G TaxID=2781961 RepID=UPI001910AFF6|nr:hypothetical protein [Echinicola sp. 20G]